MAIEPLLHKLRSTIVGVDLGQAGHAGLQLSAYADDIVMKVSGQSDVDHLAAIVQDFGCLSAAKVSRE